MASWKNVLTNNFILRKKKKIVQDRIIWYRDYPKEKFVCQLNGTHLKNFSVTTGIYFPVIIARNGHNFIGK